MGVNNNMCTHQGSEILLYIRWIKNVSFSTAKIAKTRNLFFSKKIWTKKTWQEHRERRCLLLRAVLRWRKRWYTRGAWRGIVCKHGCRSGRIHDLETVSLNVLDLRCPWTAVTTTHRLPHLPNTLDTGVGRRYRIYI